MAPAVFNQRTISDAASCIVVGFPPPNAGRVDGFIVLMVSILIDFSL